MPKSEILLEAWNDAFISVDDAKGLLLMSTELKSKFNLFKKTLSTLSKAEKCKNINDFARKYNLDSYNNIEEFDSFISDFIKLGEKAKQEIFGQIMPSLLQFCVIFDYKIRTELYGSQELFFSKRINLLGKIVSLFNSYILFGNECNTFLIILSDILEKINEFFALLSEHDLLKGIVEIGKSIFLILCNSKNELYYELFATPLIELLNWCFQISDIPEKNLASEFCQSFLLNYNENTLLKKYTMNIAIITQLVYSIPEDSILTKLMGFNLIYKLGEIDKRNNAKEFFVKNVISFINKTVALDSIEELKYDFSDFSKLIDYITSYSKRFVCENYTNVIVNYIPNFLYGNKDFIKLTFEEMLKNIDNCFILITLFLRSLNSKSINLLIERNLFSDILPVLVNDSILNDSIFNEEKPYKLNYLCELSLLLKNNNFSKTQVLNLIVDNVSLIKKGNYKKLKTSTFLFSVLSMKSSDVSMQISMFPNIFDIFVLLQKEDQKEETECIFNSTLELVKSISEKINERENDVLKLINYMANNIGNIVNIEKKHSFLIQIINFCFHAMKIFPRISEYLNTRPFTTANKILKCISDVKIIEEDIDFVMKYVMNENGEIIENVGMLYFLMNWILFSDLMPSFCNKWSNIIDNTDNIVQLYKAGANEMLLKEIGKSNDEIDGKVLLWIMRIGAFSFYKNDISFILKAIAGCNCSKANDLIEILKQIIILNNSSLNEYNDTEKVGRKFMDAIKSLGGPVIFLPLYLEKKDINYSYVTVLTSFFSLMAESDKEVFHNLHFFSIFNAIFRKIDKECFKKTLVSELITFYKLLNDSKQREMFNYFVTDFSLTKNFPYFIPNFFDENEFCLNGVDMSKFFLQFCYGYKDVFSQNNENIASLTDTLFNFFMKYGKIEEYPNQILYCAYTYLDTVVCRVCLKLAIELVKKNSNIFNEMLNELSFKPIILLLKTKDAESIKLVIQLFTLIGESGEIVVKCLLPNHVMKCIAFSNELVNVDLKDSDLLETLLEGEYSIKKHMQFLPFFCQFYDKLSPEIFDELYYYLVNEVDTINSSIYYICIIYLMYKSKDYCKWSEALQPKKIQIQKIDDAIRSINIFSSLPGITNEDYTNVYMHFLKYCLANKFVVQSTIGKILYSCIYKVFSPVFSLAKDVSFSSLMALMKDGCSAFRECSLSNSDFTPEYKQFLIEMIQNISNANYKLVVKNTHSFSIFSDVLIKLIELDEDPYDLSKEELLKIYNFMSATLKEKQGHLFSLSFVEPLFTSLSAHIYVGIKNEELIPYVNQFLDLLGADEDIGLDDSVFTSLDLFFSNINSLSEEILDDIENIEDFSKEEQKEFELPLFNRNNEVKKEYKDKEEYGKFNLRELNKKLFSSIYGWGKYKEKELVQDMSIDLYGRHLRIKSKVKSKNQHNIKRSISSVKRKVTLINDQKQKVYNATILKLKGPKKTKILIFKKKIIFQDEGQIDKIKEFKIESIKKIIFLSDSKRCELIMDNYMSILLLFDDNDNCKKFISELNIKGAIVEGEEKLNDLVINWNNKKINNFQFIYWVNMYSGKSYNDINNYPIFPWCLSNFTNNKIDLSNPKVYRNFEEKFGVLSKNVIKNYINTDKMRYIQELYNNKDELIPDFYTTTFYMKNLKLPSWANSNPSYFVLINRLALESEYVSKSLIDWCSQNINSKVVNPETASTKKFSTILKNLISSSSSTLKTDKIEELTANIVVENEVETTDDDCVKLITQGDFLYIIKAGASVMTINLSNASKENNMLSKCVCTGSAKNFLIFPEQECVIYGNPNEDTFIINNYNKENSKREEKTTFPITCIAGNDYRALVTCHNDSTVIVWKNILYNEANIIPEHYEAVIQAQSSIILNSVVTVDNNGVLIVSSYNDCIPFATVILDSVPMQTLLTNMGLIVNILPIDQDNENIIVDVKDIMCKDIIKKEFDIKFITACIAYLPNCVEHLIICGYYKLMVIRLYDMAIIKDEIMSYIPVAAAFNEKYESMIIADKTGRVHIYKI